ncbi:MAG: response regulator [Planctomycetes bacterium]|nr:response regulator [Planctomycetota bacterium]
MASAKILIVDDEALLRQLCRRILSPFGYQFLEAGNGAEALDAVARDAPDLVLLDLMMPQVNGYEVCKRLKQDPRTRLLPILAMTSLDQLRDKLEAIKVGANGFLVKPFEAAELITSVQSLLALKQFTDHTLGLQLRITLLLADPTEAAHVIPEALRIIGESLDWDLAVYWRADAHAGALHFGESWRAAGPLADFEEACRRIVLAGPEGLPGRCWIEGRPLWASDLFGEGDDPRVKENVRHPPRGALAVPVRSGDRTLGILEVVSQRPQVPDETLLKALATAGLQIGQFLDLKISRERLERSRLELEQIAKIAAHQMQEPLRLVTSYVQLLERKSQGLLGADGEEYVRYAVDGAAWMKTIVSKLLVYLEAGQDKDSLGAADSAKALERALGVLRKDIRDIGAEVTCGSLPKVRADFAELGEVFRHLLSNALTFRRSVPVRIDVSAKPEGNEWIFSVRDNGMGIPSEYHERIFELFQRLHPPGTYPGIGAGLALCRKIVESHGGRIWLESEPGQGSCFHFSLSAAPDAEPRSAAKTRES